MSVSFCNLVTIVLDLQQPLEDGEVPASKWLEDRPEGDEVETDPEAFLPAPDIVKHSAGKASSLWDCPDDDDSDIEVLEVLDPVLISYLHLAYV